MTEKTGRRWKQFRDGTHRSCHPEQTYQRIAPYLSVMGITRAANVTGLDTVGIPVYMVTRPNSRSLAVAQGKGLTPAAARISGLMESIETYHGERLDLNTRIGSFSDLASSHQVVDAGRLSRNKLKTFDDDVRIPWVEARDMFTGASVWVPYEAVHTDFTLPVCFDDGYFIADTNGLASGNCLEEAAVHGLCEVIERDALTLWALRSKAFQASRRVDLSTVVDGPNRHLVALFLAAGAAVAVWDVGMDVGVPVFLCKVAQTEKYAPIRPAMGSGCHPDRDIALTRALTEAAQSRLTFIAGARDDQLPENYRRFRSGQFEPWTREILNDTGVRPYHQTPDFKGEFINDDLDHVLSKLNTAGLGQALCVDLTKPYFGIPVVKIIVPGLENHTNPEHRVLGARVMSVMMGQPEHV